MVFCDRTAIGSDAEKQAGICLGAASVDCGAIAKGQFVSLVDVLKLSKSLKSPTNRRGKTHTSGMEKEISRKIRHTQPLKLNMACFLLTNSARQMRMIERFRLLSYAPRLIPAGISLFYTPSSAAILVMKSWALATMPFALRLPRSASLLAEKSEVSTL